MNHAVALIDAFVSPARRDRYLALLTSSKGRAKLRGKLAHFRDLDRRYVFRIAASEHTVEAISDLLRSKGAPATCYALSESVELDDRELELSAALEAVVGRGIGTFLSCIPGQLGYFEGEESGDRYLLWRTVSRIR